VPQGVRPSLLSEQLACTDSSVLITAKSRLRASKRTTTASALSFLRPAIVLYDDSSPSSLALSSAASALLDADLSNEERLPDFLIIAGTSLRIPGFKSLVKDVARAVKRQGGLCVMVNRESVGKEWEKVFDFHCSSFHPVLLRE
jgi:NAD-dependent SIR2 family protein deacetylase